MKNTTCLKYSVISLLLVIFLLTPVFNAQGTLEEASIEIQSFAKESGGFVITLKNTGEVNLRGLQVNISITGGWINPVDFQYDELIFICNCSDVFEPGDNHVISTLDYAFISSFGILDVKVDVYSYSTGSVHAEKKGFIIGSFIILF